MLGDIVNFFTQAGCSINDIQKEQYLMNTLENINNSRSVEEKAKIIREYEEREKINKTLDMFSNLLLTGVSGAFAYCCYKDVKGNLKATNKRLRNCDRYINDDNYNPSMIEQECLVADLGLDTFEDYYRDDE